MRPYKRRKFFINRKFQLKYILLVIFMLLMYTIVFVGTIFIPQILPFAFNASQEEQVKAAEVLLIYHKNIWPAVCFVIPLFGFFSIFITHKVAGPVYRLKKHLDEMTTGNLEDRLTLRSGDDLQDLADSVNQLADELQVFVAALKNNYDEISENIKILRRQIESKTLDESTGNELIMRFETSRRKIAGALEQFSARKGSNPE